MIFYKALTLAGLIMVIFAGVGAINHDTMTYGIIAILGFTLVIIGSYGVDKKLNKHEQD